MVLQLNGSGNGLPVGVALQDVGQEFVAEWGGYPGSLDVLVYLVNLCAVGPAGTPHRFFEHWIHNHKRRAALAEAMPFDLG
ncbi:MAG: hypothetical protein O3B73_10990 [bacterium]|nr:hypothetical protein [bacterium]